MAPLFESGKMQVRSLPPQFCVTLIEQFSYAPVAQLERGTELKIRVLRVRVSPGALTGCGAVVAQRFWEPKVAGSNPVIPTLPL